MGFLEVNNLTKRYHGEKQPCVRAFNLSVDQGEVCVLLGASGCGKSTVLKVIAGLEEAQEGTVTIDGEPMEGIAPEKRPVAMVFQKALLFRNMTVEQNVNFAPRVNRTMPKDELARKTSEMLELVGLGGMEKKKATALSGGQEQRVSLARALMVEPKLLLLDEPLSALDASLRETMQDYIRALNRETGTTMVLVTHDQQEAIALADRIAVMHDGRIVQIATPREFYERPRTEYVASFSVGRTSPTLRGGEMRSTAFSARSRFPGCRREPTRLAGGLWSCGPKLPSCPPMALENCAEPSATPRTAARPCRIALSAPDACCSWCFRQAAPMGSEARSASIWTRRCSGTWPTTATSHMRKTASRPFGDTP